MKIKDMSLIALFVAIMAIFSWISIPAGVPFTLQTLAVFLAVGLLGGKRGTIAVALYIFLGLIGIPVFSGFTSGIGRVLGNTGGYIIGFLGSALVMWLIIHLLGESTWVLVLSMLLGLLVCYAIGTFWFIVVYTKSSGAVPITTVLAWCVIPFIIPDLVKIALAVLLTKRLRRIIAAG